MRLKGFLGAVGLAAVIAGTAHGQRFAGIDAAIRRGISLHIYPAAVVVVGRADTILYSKGYGRYTWSSRSRVPDPESSLWDLASLSKVVATTSATAVLVDQGLLDLDAPVHQYLPEFVGAGKSQVTVRMLLNHTSGLPADSPLYRAGSPGQALARLFSVPLVRPAGESMQYSDLNAMLAGLIVERITGKRLDAYADSAVFAPLGMTATTYNPPRKERVHAVPTARWHGTPIAGVVNDQNAKVLGGVAGHAGLFSTGIDLAHFAQSWLKDSTAGDHAMWLGPATVEQFLEHSPTSGTRVLGWDTPNLPGEKPSMFGECATSTTIGHTGWTGTEIWLDPAENVFVVLLTNRSYQPRSASRSFEQLGAIRARVADVVRQSLGLCDGLAVRAETETAGLAMPEGQ
jgi:CubicO group peptidase (beta-lactamase class C family)